MARKLIGSAKENLYYHNTLILHKSEKQTVKNQFYEVTSVCDFLPYYEIEKLLKLLKNSYGNLKNLVHVQGANMIAPV